MTRSFAIAIALAFSAVPARASDSVNRTPIAFLHNATLDVQIRRAGELVWEAPKTLARLFNHDAVKTGANSSAVVQFFDETTLTVSENSIVVVVSAQNLPSGRGSALALSEGKVRSHVARNIDRPVEVTLRTARGWIRASSATQDAKGSSFTTQVSANGGVKITQESGDVTLQTQNHTHTLGPHESIYLAPPVPRRKDDDSYITRLPKVPKEAWEKAVPSARKAVVKAPDSAKPGLAASAPTPAPVASENPPPPGLKPPAATTPATPISAPKLFLPTTKDGAPL